MELSPDKVQAQRIADSVNAADSDSIRSALFNLIDAEKPSIDTLALACGLLKPSAPNANWHEQMRLALSAQLQAMLTKAQIESQQHLSDAADKLARRNFYVSVASMIVAVVSLVVAFVK